VSGLPLLWHLKVSHYNEKARWALDYKRIPHTRRALIPGRHRAIARKLTGESTFPVLVHDGVATGGSARIIAALERLGPEPSLYPAEPAQRRRALELERYFDEALGPHVRLLVLHAVLPDAGLTLGTFASDLHGVQRLGARAAFPALRRRLIAEFSIDDARIEHALKKVKEVCARFRAELQPSGYLVGDRFGVADLTLAALASPAVAPPEFPYPQPQRGHARLATLRDALAEFALVDWTRGIYVRHRGRSAEVRDGYSGTTSAATVHLP
jgi:glutathione S-transferase